ncbi:ankyrin repeat domain-containing protein [Azoarcus sp. L1K30]|uniref:ankyrin repeat domain-containing protein n=1 Tax=Azoarcus sp. L1K30 TaxID=2820277 RepID=UPI001B81B998|nr:ankyrin repeat domain-containing protein [Azoarcus sp. L1K30]MBR0566537.1 ankyrin repeat domain-containing protein [Azoarcus sp. L1K30]
MIWILQGCTHYSLTAASPDLEEVQRVWGYCVRCVSEHSCPNKEECELKTMTKPPRAIIKAISRQRLDVVRYLIEVAGMDVNTIIDDTYHDTVLHTAAYYRSDKVFEILRYLVSAGADVNALGTSHARTPLLTAIWKGNTEGARFLLAHGADPSIQSDRGWDACMFAHRWSHWAIMPDLPGCCAKFLDKRWDGDPVEARVRPPELIAACRPAAPGATPGQ